MKIAIQASINGKLLSAEYGGGITSGIALTANRDEIKGFETFEEIKLPNGCFALKCHTGNYVTADIDGTVRTNATEIGAWENLRWNNHKIDTIHNTRLTARIDKTLVPIETTENNDIWENFARISLAPEIPVGNKELDKFPRIGCSVANVFMANHYDYHRYIQMLGDNKIDMAGVNLTSAHWKDMAGHNGTYPWLMPSRPGDEPINLYSFNQAYLDKLYDVINNFHSQGIHVILCILNLYDWSNRKMGGDIPDANRWHWRNNVNGVKWGGAYNGDRKQDDATLTSTPDEACKALLDFLAPVWKINGGISIKIGNEYPEKDLHSRMRDYIRRHNNDARFIVNRNEDTSGQYQNMKIGKDYHMIDYHGWDSMAFLDKKWDNGNATDRPETFRQFFDKVDERGKPIDVDHKRCIANSDGCRDGDKMPPNTYNWDDLYEVHKFCYEKGCSIDHQSQVKMSFNLDDLEVDYLRRLNELR